MGITENEIADKSAILAHFNDRSELTHLTQHETMSILKKNFRNYWNDYWKITSDITGKGLFLKLIRDNIDGNGPIPKSKSRKSETVFQQMRIGHVPLNFYLERFKLITNNQCQHCGLPETIQHYFLQCNNYQIQRDTMKVELLQMNINDIDLKTLLAGNERYKSKRNDIMKITMKYIKDTKRFDHPQV